MDQTQTTNSNVDNDLQKAIDDIANTTSIDPVFSDPVAAPSSVPEGDTGELGEPVGPFPEPKIEVPTPTTEPLAPIESIDIPDLTVPEPVAEPTPTIETAPAPQSTTEVKKAALRDLIPLLDKVSMSATEKFNIYRDIFEELKDYTVLEPAYQAAREIPDETTRANSLLYLVQAIDRM
ncbi:hypothetical protein J6X04_02275 [Candidatus Saccharibacteria bacterium]|nr:hypothetical protein [Candidatus Saccharibacteria bacterium]